MRPRSSGRGQEAPRHAVSLMYRVYRYILPEVSSQLDGWREVAEQIPDPELRKQAIASMTSKRFHCEGGAVYAAANLNQRHVLIPFIVAFQTISDYLDNLCDRSTSLDPADFRMLHQSMLDAVDPSTPLHDYYAYRAEQEDGGYLAELVRTCQSCVCMLPSYELVAERVRELVALYCDLQVYKHIHPDDREHELFAWWDRHKANYPDLKWNEFAAATGSTLGVFMLMLAASDRHMVPERSVQIRRSYFPYVCSLHILLDYLIDQEEDIVGGDLNFCSYYEDASETSSRLQYIVSKAREAVASLDDPAFHRMIIEGLLALYLSDPKAKVHRATHDVTAQLMKRSPIMRLFFFMNSRWIRAIQGQ